MGEGEEEGKVVEVWGGEGVGGGDLAYPLLLCYTKLYLFLLWLSVTRWYVRNDLLQILTKNSTHHLVIIGTQ